MSHSKEIKTDLTIEFHLNPLEAIIYSLLEHHFKNILSVNNIQRLLWSQLSISEGEIDSTLEGMERKGIVLRMEDGSSVYYCL